MAEILNYNAVLDFFFQKKQTILDNIHRFKDSCLNFIANEYGEEIINISMDALAAFNQELNQLLEEDNIIPINYVITKVVEVFEFSNKANQDLNIVLNSFDTFLTQIEENNLSSISTNQINTIKQFRTKIIEYLKINKRMKRCFVIIYTNTCKDLEENSYDFDSDLCALADSF